MGIDSVYEPPKRIKREKLEEFLRLLGYVKDPAIDDDKGFIQKYKPTYFTYFSPKPYESLQGVSFTVMIAKDKLIAHGRNSTWRSYSDNEFHNYTLKQLRKYLGGHFDYGHGKNKDCQYDGVLRKNDEAGCHTVIERTLGHVQNIKLLLQSISIKYTLPIIKDSELSVLNNMHPEVLFSNLVNINILSIIEDFFRSIYVALLTYSDKKEEVISASKIQNLYLIDIAAGKLRLEQAWAKGLNFQNIKYICENFNKLDQSLGSKIRKELNEPYNGNNTLYEFIERVTKSRNIFVHHNKKCLEHDLKLLDHNLNLCNELVHSIYKLVAKTKHWHYDGDLEPSITEQCIDRN